MKKSKKDFPGIIIKFLEDNSPQKYKYISDWLKICEDSKKPQEDTWTEIVSISGYIFKNLRMKTNSISGELPTHSKADGMGFEGHRLT